MSSGNTTWRAYRSKIAKEKGFSTTVLKIVLVRHAECTMNLRYKDTIGGRSHDSPLTEKGVSQAKALGTMLRGSKQGVCGVTTFDHVFTSVAKRTKDTAKIVCDEIGFDTDKIVESEDLVELSQGEWAGKPRNQCYTPQVFEKVKLYQIKADPLHFAAPGGESMLDVEKRMLSFIENRVFPLWEKAKVENKPAVSVCIFSHGVAMKCLLHGILQFDPANTWKIQLANTAVIVLSKDEIDGWLVEGVNQAPHLPWKL